MPGLPLARTMPHGDERPRANGRGLDPPETTIPAHERSSDRVFDRYADAYGEETAVPFATRLKYELVLRHLAPGLRVLDVGCANAVHMRRLAPHCAQLEGVDINDRMLAAAERVLAEGGHANARVSKQSATTLG